MESEYTMQQLSDLISRPEIVSAFREAGTSLKEVWSLLVSLRREAFSEGVRAVMETDRDHDLKNSGQ